ncbi:MAG: hypothetical protein OEL76_12540 [Siculibacillus sp.]|nr:hypothetical protein [Siculibacillus sp.]
MSAHRLCLVHPVDPRVDPQDLVASRLRTVLAAKPADFSVLVVGVDARGDLATGISSPVDVDGRRVDFLPLARRGEGSFAAALLRHLSAVRTAARAEIASLSVHDFTWVPLARLVGRPIVLVVHRDPRAEAVAGRVPLTTALRETLALRVADRIIGCDVGFVHRCRDVHPVVAGKTELLALATGEDDGAVPLITEDARISRLWERHRRLFDAHAVHRGRPAAA